MAISTEYSAQDFTGNGSNPYPVGFPVDSAGDVWVAVKLDGETEFTTLSRADFTVTDLGGGSFEVTTDTGYVSADTVKVFRAIEISQPFEFPEGGPFPSRQIERAYDRLLMLIQQVRLEAGLEGAAVQLPGDVTTVKGLIIAADATARTATKPAFAGQVLVQLSPSPMTLWTSATTTVGDWTQIQADRPAVRYFSTTSAMNAATPEYVGQIAWVGDSQYQYRATATTVGAWTSNAARVFRPWTADFWQPNEVLEPGQVRRGAIAGDLRTIATNPYAAVAFPGYGPLTLRTRIVGLLPSILLADPDIVIGATAVTGGSDSSAAAMSRTPQFSDRLEVEVISNGYVVEIAVTAGSVIATPTSGSKPYISTGTPIQTAQGTFYVVALRNDGTIELSHPANATASSLAGNAGAAVMVRGLTFSSTAAGQTQVAIDATSATLVQVGDPVIGLTISPGTVVTAISGGNVTLSKPLLDATSALTILGPGRTPVTHYKAASGNLAASGAGTVTLPVTSRIRSGDSVIGTNVPANAYVTGTTSTTSTQSSTLTGDITELTVCYPKRTATASAGATVLTTNAGTVPVGSLVTGVGIPPETYVASAVGTSVTLNKPIAVALSSKSVEFSRDDIKVTAAVTATSTTATLPFAVDTTAIEVGMYVEGAEIPTGTFVAGVSGSNVTLTNAVPFSNAAATLRFRRPTQWTGLTLTVPTSVPIQ